MVTFLVALAAAEVDVFVDDAAATAFDEELATTAFEELEELTPHVPKLDWQPVEQYADVLPHLSQDC